MREEVGRLGGHGPFLHSEETDGQQFWTPSIPAAVSVLHSAYCCRAMVRSRLIRMRGGKRANCPFSMALTLVDWHS